MRQKVVCLLVAVVLMLPSCGISEAGCNDLQNVRYNYIGSIYASLVANGYTAACTAYGHGVNSNTTTQLRVSLQKLSADGSSWSTLTSWTTTANGTETATIEESYNLTSNNSYRLRVRCRIKDSNGNILETAYEYSSVVSV